MSQTAQVIHRSTLKEFGFVPPKGFAEWLKETGRGEIVEDVIEVKKDD